MLDWLRAMTGRKVEAPRAEITTSQELERVLMSRDRVSAAGVVVTPETAMMVAAVSAAVSLLSEALAQLPLHIYRRADAGKERQPEHSVALLLGNAPNTWQTGFEFRELMTACMLLWGNAYAIKTTLRTGPRAGQARELLPVPPDRVRVEQAKDYSITYRIALPDAAELVLPQSAVFHLRDRTVDGVVGMSRLKSGRDSIGLAQTAEKWGAQLFGNGAQPSGLLTTDQNLAPEQMIKIKESWQSSHGGENALGTAVIDGGLKWQSLAMNMDDAQFLETRKFQVAEVARLYRIPPHMIGDLEKATFSNIEQQSLEFVKYSLMPWVRRWEQAINRQLLGDRREVFAEFLLDGLLRGDTLTRYQAYQIAITNGWMSPNEVRERENMNPRDGGDEFMPAANLFGDQTQGETDDVAAN